MRHLPYLIGAYVFAGGAVGAYLLSIRRRHRFLRQRLEDAMGRGAGRSEVPPG